MKEKFSIQGMHCSSCARHIEKDVSSLEGVHSCSVNLLQETMLVDFDTSIISQENIIAMVKNGGFNASVVHPEKRVSNDQNKRLQIKKKRVITSFILLIPLMYLSMGTMVGITPPTLLEGGANILLLVSVQCILTCVILYIHKHYFVNGIYMLFKRTPNMDSLIALGAGASFLYSGYLMFLMYIYNNDMMYLHTHAHNLYFESAAMIVTLISLGKYLEDRSKKKTSEAVSKLMDLSTKSVVVIRDGAHIEIESEDILRGDHVLIKPGMNIPVDGTLIEGRSSVDESSISGESNLLEKGVGDSLISGTFNTNGSFVMEAQKVGSETTLAQIIQLVEDANASKPALAKLADKISGVFVPVVIALSILSFIVWISMGYSFSFSLSIAIAVLVISCPCALGLATPTAVMVGSGRAAEHGILLKRSESLETLYQSDVIILDKTGTITYGKPSLMSIHTQMNTRSLLQIVASIEQGSEHPLSRAIMEYAAMESIELLDTVSFEAKIGRGAQGVVNDTLYFVGNQTMMRENNVAIAAFEDISDTLAQKGETPLYVSDEQEVLGVISLRDKIKPSSVHAIQKMKEKGLEVYMVTGDNKISASIIQQELGLDDVYAEALPQDKEAFIQELQSKGKKVIMVGDGINDAPALSRADTGIAIGAGSDIALECADVVLIKNDLMDVLSAVTLSQRIVVNIKQNLFWAFFYNVIGIPLAAGVFYLPFGILLNPMFGAAAMSLSSVCVVLNALRLKRA